MQIINTENKIKGCTFKADEEYHKTENLGLDHSGFQAKD